LIDLTIHLENGGSEWFGLMQYPPDRPLKMTVFYRALDPYK
jgi:hypothetical protein